MARGNQGQAIFQHPGDRRSFLKVLGEACEKTGRMPPFLWGLESPGVGGYDPMAQRV